MFYVYQITGPTGVYIGKSNKPKERWKRHRYLASKQETRTRLCAAIRKYGVDCFFMDLVLTAVSSQNALAAERDIIKQMRLYGVTLYNMTEGGEGPPCPPATVRVCSPQTREKLRLAHLGKPHPRTPEWTARHRQTLLGRPLSGRHKADISRTLRFSHLTRRVDELCQGLATTVLQRLMQGI